MKYKIMPLVIIIFLLSPLSLYSYGNEVKPSLNIIPSEITLNKGQSQQFIALLGEEQGQLSRRIDWRVDGVQGNTSIDHTGVLSVGENETSPILIVTATFKEDVSRFGRAIVHVIDNKVSQQYTLTVINGTGSGRYDPNIQVLITAHVPEGKVFDHWEASKGSIENLRASQTLFTMPQEDTMVIAYFRDL